MKKLLKFMLPAVAVLIAAACQQSEIDDLERNIADLGSRLKALETQVDVLNANVEAIQKLLNGATINSVEEKNGVYTVTLSNGEVLTLTQGSEGGYYTPTISVDAEGYWTVSFDNKTFTRITDADGKPVRAIAESGATGAKGEDGTTPQFKVDASGHWLVSYDGGKSFAQVLDADGKPVSATGGAVSDKFFADVRVEGSMLVVALLDGQTCRVPILENFKCVIAGADQIVTFALKETRDFGVTMDGVAHTVVTTPEGWSAELTAKESTAADGSTHTLRVSAPAAPADAVRAVADTRTDVCILAVADNGLSTIAKLRVATSDMVLHTPVVTSVTVDDSKTTETSLTFTVETDDANGWKYLCLPSSEAAPEAAEVFEQGQAGAAGAVTAEGLVQGTAYTIYVVAHYDSTVGAVVATAQARTVKAAVDYWEQGVTLAGVTYDKNTAGATLVTASTEISKPGVYFLDPDAGAEIKIAKCTVTNMVLIGRHSKVRAKVTLATGPISLGNGLGLIMKNVEFDAVAYNNYVFNFASGTVNCQNLMFDECKFLLPAGKHFSYFNNAAGTIENVEITNSIFDVKATADGQAVRILNFNAGVLGKRMVIDNSIVYTDGHTTHGALVHVNAATQVMPDVTVDVTNCSFINYIGQPNAYFYLSTVKRVNFSNNIMWSRAYAKESFTLRFYVDNACTDLDFKNNIVYGLAENNSNCWKYVHPDSKYKPEEGGFTKADADPFSVMDFATDTFVAADKNYGAEL